LQILTVSATAHAAVPSHAEHSIPVVFIEQPGCFVAAAPGMSGRFEPGSIWLSGPDQSLRLVFVGASRPKIEGAGRLTANANLLMGPDASSWQTGLALFRELIYKGIYPGIDLRVGTSSGKLKFDWIVSPGADPGLIQWRYEGAQGLRVTETGDLVVRTGQGELSESAPFVYQPVGAERRTVAGKFLIGGEGRVGFELGEFDRSLPLVVDPVLSFSTYVGGARNDNAGAIAVDAAGNVYVAGWTESSGMPVANPVRAFSGSVDAYVFKLNPAGTQLVYATFIGGSGDDRAHGIAVDSTGAAYVVGATSSPGFPVAAAAQATYGGGRDAVVFKLNATGNALVYSTYLGGSGSDTAYGIDVDPYGQAYIAGETSSVNFPTRLPFQAANRGGTDAFTAKLSDAGALIYSTYIGGSGNDGARGIAISQNQLTAYITGHTWSANFPVLNPVQPSSAGGQDAFVTRFNSDANAIVFSTYLGGSGGSPGSQEIGLGIAVDSFNNAYVAGSTSSTNFPRLNAYQSAFLGGVQDAFLTKIGSGGVLMFSTYLGGVGADWATAVRVDSSRRPYVTGYTSSVNFPLAAPTQATLRGSYDVFISQFENTGASIIYSSYIGGTGTDAGYGIALADSGEMFVAGATASSDFPTQSAFNYQISGGLDMFVLHLTAAAVPPSAPSVVSLSPSVGSGMSQTFTVRFTDPNGANDLVSTQVLVNSTFSGISSCHIVYVRTTNLMYLLNDTATAWLGGLPPGSPTLLQNSQCILDLASMTVNQSGNDLILQLPLEFTPAYSGLRRFYLMAQDAGGLRADWTQYGLWTVP
jgi:hypothetical protein